MDAIVALKENHNILWKNLAIIFWTNFLAIKILLKHSFKQHANKIMSSSPWLRLVDFALRLVNSVIHFLNLHDGLVNFLENSNHRRTVFRALQKFCLGFMCMHLKWLLGYYILSTLYKSCATCPDGKM